MSKNMPNLRNLAMELRKVCCHPWLCNGLEDDMMMKRQAAGSPADTLDVLVHSSGKMLLLHKLLPKLRGEGRKVQPMLWPEAFQCRMRHCIAIQARPRQQISRMRRINLTTFIPEGLGTAPACPVLQSLYRHVA